MSGFMNNLGTKQIETVYNLSGLQSVVFNFRVFLSEGY